MSDYPILRVYTRPEEIGKDGYPKAWHRCVTCLGDGCAECGGEGSAKDLVRALAENRCVRCLHPYVKGQNGRGEWSACSEDCSHPGPIGLRRPNGDIEVCRTFGDAAYAWGPGRNRGEIVAQWRILTVHHLTGDKTDLRWWNLASLCQRCHLTIQGRVDMQRVYPWPHSDWFKPYAAGWYAFAYLGEELARVEVDERLDELLGLELAA